MEHLPLRSLKYTPNVKFRRPKPLRHWFLKTRLAQQQKVIDARRRRPAAALWKSLRQGGRQGQG